MLAPKGSLEIHEEAWNCYPFCKTVITVGRRGGGRVRETGRKGGGEGRGGEGRGQGREGLGRQGGKEGGRGGEGRGQGREGLGRHREERREGGLDRGGNLAELLDMPCSVCRILTT